MPSRTRAAEEREAMSRRTIVFLVIGIVTLLALAGGLAAWLTSGSSSSTASHAEYARLFESAVLGKTTVSEVEKSWPQPPYQNFHDGTGNHCFEWFDKPAVGNGILYDLCFGKNGVLVSKQTP
jgi:hypothetical protein